MPIAKATLSTIKANNGVAGVTQCFFPGLTKVRQKYLDEASGMLSELRLEDSVAEFDEVDPKDQD